ncbi:hypothetical protein [Sinorhizobium meliloti]|uniref:hypothetical protein n=1 Tax=Rhizobium meliloti TaxID=382 RepID=UPI003F17158A
MEKKTRKSQQQSHHRAPAKRNPKGDQSRDEKTVTDPHPGSVSDGTHPEATEEKH